MNEWKFRRVRLEDKDLIEEYFHRYPARSCDRTFFGVLLWGKHYHLDFAFTGKAILFVNWKKGDADLHGRQGRMRKCAA